MSEKTILKQIDARGVATLTLNRPDVHNAFGDELIADLAAAFDEVGQDPDVRVVILAGAGKSFSAGADLSWMRRMAEYSLDKNIEDAEAFGAMMQTLKSIPKPTIAKVHGPAYAGAVGLVCACDIALAARSARFVISEVKLGLIPAVISPYIIAAIGERQARRYVLTAEAIEPEEAQRIGLVHQVAEDEKLDDLVEAAVCHLLNNSPAALAESKTLITAVAGRPLDDQLVKETAEKIAHVRASVEGKEGVNSFLEKRKPFWVGGDQ